VPKTVIATVTLKFVVPDDTTQEDIDTMGLSVAADLLPARDGLDIDGVHDAEDYELTLRQDDQ
jgi:hypothetical protein